MKYLISQDLTPYSVMKYLISQDLTPYSLGRFLSPDPITQRDKYQPQDHNLYSYAMNNPMRLTDPTGMSWWDTFWNWFTGKDDEEEEEKKDEEQAESPEVEGPDASVSGEDYVEFGGPTRGYIDGMTNGFGPDLRKNLDEAGKKGLMDLIAIGIIFAPLPKAERIIEKLPPVIVKEAQKLIKLFEQGHKAPGGMSIKHLGKDIYYLRGSKGARVFIKGEGASARVVAVSDKAKEDQVIRLVKETFGL